ncbi:MAG: prolyl oligopeptidase family serine peptidase [Minicystis sp.]
MTRTVRFALTTSVFQMGRLCRTPPCLLIALCLSACAQPSPPSTPSAGGVPAPATAAPSPPAFSYPPAPRGAVVDDFHGVKVADPYRWLEALDAPETRAWVTAENRVTDAYFAEIPGQEAVRARLAQLFGAERWSLPRHHGARYFWVHNDGKHDQAALYGALSLDGTAAVLLDPNTLSPDGSLAFAGFAASNDGARVAYGLSIGGGDWQKWRVREAATTKDLPGELAHIKYYPPSFTRDGAGIYYSRFPAPPPGRELLETDHDCKVYLHAIGADVAKDAIVYERPDQPTWQFDPKVTRDGRYLVITIGDGQVGDRGMEQIVYLDLGAPHPKPVPLVDTFDAEYIFLGNEGPVFYFKTTLGAPKKRVIAIDTRTPARAKWKEIVPEGANTIEDASLVAHKLIVTTLKDAHAAVAVYDLEGKKLRDVALPGLGTAWGFDGGPDDKEVYYTFTSFTTPPSIYRLDLATGVSAVWKTPSVAFDASRLETKQVFYPSKDGTKIPMFVTAKKGLALDGNNPTLLTGYGGGGFSMTPYFDPVMIAWIERGGVFALANIRGGGEYGEAWHQAAIREHKQVGYDDFIAGAEWLIASKHTSAGRLGIFGTSGGGLLVAAVTMQRPELFGASVPIAGVHDMLRFPLFGQGAGWEGEMGSPAKPTEFKALYAYSPLHNVRAGTRYPAMLVLTADHDVRVAPLHSYKLAAALQAAQAGASPVLLRVETTSGHGGGTTVSRRVDQHTELLSFFARNLGLSWK